VSNFSQSRLSAKLQNLVSKRREESGLYKEIAEKLPLYPGGRVLDVGTGSGLQLKVIHEIEPDIELFGLDLSASAIAIAQENLSALDVDLRVGSIEKTTYEDDFFEIVTCNSSMSYWENPIACFNEIYRILKPGSVTHLFEPQEDIDLDEVVKTIKANLADESWLRRFAAVNLNKFGLRYGRRVGLNLYSVSELEDLTIQSRFGDSFTIERTTLQNLPIFSDIHLIKPDEDSSLN
jgi:ubiquinone/menaquinone biosynthesis C-methylase UbiE